MKLKNQFVFNRESRQLVLSIAKKFASDVHSVDRYVIKGNIGLLKAAANYDSRVGFSFYAFASWWIRKEMMAVGK